LTLPVSFGGYVIARGRGGNCLGRLRYGAGFAIAVGLLGTMLAIASGRLLGHR
jgi:hypothetical protein